MNLLLALCSRLCSEQYCSSLLTKPLVFRCQNCNAQWPNRQHARRYSWQKRWSSPLRMSDCGNGRPIAPPLDNCPRLPTALATPAYERNQNGFTISVVGRVHLPREEPSIDITHSYLTKHTDCVVRADYDWEWLSSVNLVQNMWLLESARGGGELNHNKIYFWSKKMNAYMVRLR